MSASPKAEEVEARIAAMKEKASTSARFSQEELDSTIKSFQNLASYKTSVDWAALRDLLTDSAHLSYKDWTRTEAFAQRLSALLSGPDNPTFREMFHRVLGDGGWDAAVQASNEKPWVVLVCGLNGIRKTSSMYQPWFKDVLFDALSQKYPDLVKAELPSGDNAFFRQLDYIIATIANEEFRALYGVDNIELYAGFKEGIFARYRMVAEMMGVLLMKEAQKKKINVMVETSGRDIGMYHYVDQVFPASSGYRKLAVHFEINDISFAEKSVDVRMAQEMIAGSEAVRRGASTREVIMANAGGPYGSKVLKKVQADSNEVWENVLAGVSGLSDSESWHKASIYITACDEEEGEWTASAVPSRTVTLKRKFEALGSSAAGGDVHTEVQGASVYSFSYKR